jgi:hypothetical protein
MDRQGGGVEHWQTEVVCETVEPGVQSEQMSIADDEMPF